MNKAFRRSLGLSSLILVLACGSKARDATTVEATGGAAGSTSGGAGAAGIPTDLLPTSEPVGGAAGADPGQHTPVNPTAPSVAEVPVGSSVAGTTCQISTECSSLSCQGGSCSTTACLSDGAACAAGTECCGGRCDNGTCAALNTLCKTAGNACTGPTECCSGLCAEGVCSVKSSFCTQTGDVCGRDAECCTGTCDLAEGATVGSCAPPPSPGATNCSGGVDGSLCNDCGSCCSRLCAPFGDTGVNICQPANGCHVNGDLCREDSDCCGGAGSGLPGDGNVTCEKEDGREVGVCRNPRSCSPQGNVCHFQDYACSISSSRNNCCGGQGNSGACQLDPLGVPRCNALDACRAAGETCASSVDCCDGRLCVPDTAGQLRCSTSEDPTACVPSGGGCSVSGDCCRGILCNTLPGSTRGTCGGTPSSSDPTPGSGGEGSGGAGSGGSGDPGTPPEPTYSCAVYGQQCAQSTDCCSGVPCTGGICAYPVVIR